MAFNWLYSRGIDWRRTLEKIATSTVKHSHCSVLGLAALKLICKSIFLEWPIIRRSTEILFFKLAYPYRHE
jgi:hypothetical protein